MRDVTQKIVAKNVFARNGKSKRNTDYYKEKIQQKVVEKPVVIMIPAVYAERPIEYLSTIETKGRSKKVIKEAIELLKSGDCQ